MLRSSLFATQYCRRGDVRALTSTRIRVRGCMCADVDPGHAEWLVSFWRRNNCNGQKVPVRGIIVYCVHAVYGFFRGLLDRPPTSPSGYRSLWAVSVVMLVAYDLLLLLYAIWILLWLRVYVLFLVLHTVTVYCVYTRHTIYPSTAAAVCGEQ